MSTKSVKITNGKILNYKISASGYKTIYGSQLISSDTAITKEMISESDPNEVYSLGDRIGGCASFVCYFNSTNPETNVDQKYAVFVLDARFRKGGLYLGNSRQTGSMPTYRDSTVKDAAESATWNTTYMCSINTSSSAPAFFAAREAAILNLGQNSYQSQLPNVYELQQICLNKSYLDIVDPTLSDYPNNSLSNWNMESAGQVNAAYSSNIRVYGESFTVTKDNTIGVIGNTNTSAGMIPVFEIPVE